ncbi:MAG: hypothetical protein KF690_02660 [Bacteroidetes bacterium]|nr:hypothetical protein [Bacteroidota bacterium]
MKYRILLSVLCLLCMDLSIAAAQDKATTSFVDMQNDMLALMEQQMPKITRMQENADKVWKEVSEISYLLSFPKNVKAYRDSSITALVALRKRNDLIYYQAQEIWFQWWPHNMNLMAVYTRYGELKAGGKPDDNLRMFLLKYRTLVDTMNAVLKLNKDIYNECDFLLNTKLN